VVSVVVFAGGLRGPAVAVTVADDAVVRWLAGLRMPGLLPAMRTLAALGSWVAISALLYGLLAALLILRRLRQLLIVLAAWIMQGVIIQYIAAPLAQRPRPFGVVFLTGWDAWALPSEKMAALVVTLLGILYALVPEGRWRQRGKWAAAAVVLLVAIAHLYLGVLAPTDVLVGVAVGVAIPLAGFRLFAPGEVFPVTYRLCRVFLDGGGGVTTGRLRGFSRRGVVVAGGAPGRPAVSNRPDPREPRRVSVAGRRVVVSSAGAGAGACPAVPFRDGGGPG
jgi:membrane-associated phospholipid phosphatase